MQDGDIRVCVSCQSEILLSPPTKAPGVSSPWPPASALCGTRAGRPGARRDGAMRGAAATGRVPVGAAGRRTGTACRRTRSRTRSLTRGRSLSTNRPPESRAACRFSRCRELAAPPLRASGAKVPSVRDAGRPHCDKKPHAADSSSCLSLNPPQLLPPQVPARLRTASGNLSREQFCSFPPQLDH